MALEIKKDSERTSIFIKNLKRTTKEEMDRMKAEAGYRNYADFLDAILASIKKGK